MDTRNKNGPLTVNGAMYIAPISNTGSNPIFGIINNYPPASNVKDVLAEVPPEVDRRMPEQLDWELMVLMYEQCDSESVPLFLRKQQEYQAQEQNLQEQERQVQEQERRMHEQLDQERRQFTEAAIKMGRERAALRAEREAFEEEKRSLETQAILFSLSETPCQPWQQAGPAQSTPTLAVSTNSVNDLQDFEISSPFTLPAPSSNSKLSNNRTPSSTKRAVSPKGQSKDKDEDVIMGSINTSTTISMSASQQSLTAVSMRRNTTGSKQLTTSTNTATVDKSHGRSSPIEKANMHPLDSTTVQEKNYLRRQDTAQPQPTGAIGHVSRRSGVVSQGVEENLTPSAPASQDWSGKMASASYSSAARQHDFKTNKMKQLQSVNAKFKATDAPSLTSTSASPRSLAFVATKAASAANVPQKQQSVPSTMTNPTRSTGSEVLSRNSSLTFSESSEDNSGSTVLVNRTTSDKMPTALGKKVTVTSAAQDEPDKSKSRVSSRPSKTPVVATTTRQPLQ